MIWDQPNIAFNGVRISWLSVARNSSFILPALLRLLASELLSFQYGLAFFFHIFSIGNIGGGSIKADPNFTSIDCFKASPALSKHPPDGAVGMNDAMLDSIWNRIYGSGCGGDCLKHALTVFGMHKCGYLVERKMVFDHSVDIAHSLVGSKFMGTRVVVP